ncbi:uncharacterized protein ALTATR162_LOCUS10468 [Alternaria atra]|uniref:Rhodopsin domain-containing protein n=1 Tax=Alternaria atra TaxID=119953 RepID=A0A8J2I4M0_9PLEO|nr:uncharacterized protein ALTATR162_LOCUS8273 [Alternaria atra]XP_043174039.1 uncharacterized protein ALTATR162_LOCUS10468 [Alternaria atra]CAG5176011.1 unnamed protein product [Alternaria atra]CAG5183211.1 unnamed protein product [Alternaria atra]
MADHQEAVVRHPGHAASLKFTIGLCLCYTLCVACLRGFTRWRAYSIDDVFVMLSGVLALSFFGIVFASISAGLGRPMTELDLISPAIDKLNGYIIAGNILWITSLCISKLAIIAMLLRTTQTLHHRRCQYGVGTLIVTQSIASILLLTVNCSAHSEFAWNMTSVNSECPQMERRWHALTALDAVTEVLLLFLPIQLVWSLQMSFRTKITVISAFWLRLPTLVFSALRQREMHKLTTASNVPLTAAIVVIWQAVELSYSLAAATIAALKRFTESLNTGFGHGELMRVHGSSQGYKLSGRSATSRNTKGSRKKAPRSNTHEVSIDIVSSQASSQAESSFDHHVTRMKLRPEVLRNTAIVSSPSKSSAPRNKQTDALGSENNTIRQEVRYSIHYEEDITRSKQ